MDFTFLLSSKKSGGAWLSKIMNNHSDYCAPPVTHLFQILLENRLRYGDLTRDENWQILLEDTSNILKTKLGKWVTNWDVAELKSAIWNRSFTELLKGIYQGETFSNDKNHALIYDKRVYRFLPFLLSNFENIKLIYLVRDPRDFTWVWKNTPDVRGGVIRAAKQWQQDQYEYLRVAAYLNEKGKILTLRYEELISDPKAHLKRLCEFLDIDFDLHLLDIKNDEKVFLPPDDEGKVEDGNGSPESQSAYVGNQYRNVLTRAEIQYIEAVCEEEMTVLGYEKDFKRCHSIKELENFLQPEEVDEKPGYKELSKPERLVRQRRRTIVEKIKRRPVLTISGQIQTEKIYL